MSPKFVSSCAMEHDYVHRLADVSFQEGLRGAMHKVLQRKAELLIADDVMSAEQFAILRTYLDITKNIFVHSHALFKTVYAETDGLALVNSFLSLLSDLPEEIVFMGTCTDMMFQLKLELLLPTDMQTSLQTLTQAKLSELMLQNENFVRLSAHQQGLFLNILTKIRDDLLAATNRDFVLALPVDVPVLNMTNIRSVLGLDADQLREIIEELDALLQNEFEQIMMFCFNNMVSRHFNTTVSSYITNELKGVDSAHAFYNKQLDYALKTQALVDMENAFDRQLSKNKHVTEDNQAFYRLCLTARFYPLFPETQVSKINSVEAVQKLLSYIAGNDKIGIQEKLLQFEVLFVLAEQFTNGHYNPRLDKKLGITHTRTWRAVMGDIRNTAYAQLMDKRNYPHNLFVNQHVALTTALKMPLFNEHRDNHANLFFKRKTSTVKKIQQALANLDSYRQQTSNVVLMI